MTRRKRLAQCALVVGAASVGALVADTVETGGLDAALGAPTVFRGLAVGVFLILLVAGTVALGRLAERKARPPWAVLTMLTAYLLLALARHRSAPGPADPVADAGAVAPVHAHDETFLMLTTTLAALCVLNALGELRRIVRLAPASAENDWKAAIEAAPPWTEEPAEPPELAEAPSLRSLDDQLADVPLMEEAAAPDLDTAPPAPPPSRPAAPPAAGRAKRLFE